MSKKIFYGLVIVAMLVMAFGAQGLGGVQKVSAAPDYGAWHDARTTADTITAPWDYNGTVDLSTAKNDVGGDLGGCAVAPGAFGMYQLHATETLAAGASTYKYVRVHIQATGVHNQIQYSWALRISENDAGLTELGCALNNPTGSVDLIVAVPAGYGYVLTLASTGAFVPDANVFQVVVVESTFGAGLLINQLTDCGAMNLRVWEATNQADANDGLPPVLPATDQGNGRYYVGVNNLAWGTFLDVPAGIYNLGVADQNPNVAPIINQFAAYYPNITVDATHNLITLHPCQDSVVPLKEVDTAGVNLPHVLVTPASFGLNHDLDLGPLGVATDPAGTKNFNVNPGYLWDLALFNNGGLFRQLFLYYNAFNPTLGTLIFHDSYTPDAFFSFVSLCADSGYHNGFVTLNPDGQLNPRTFEWQPVQGGLCGSGTSGSEMLLSPAAPQSPNYVVSDLYLLESGWRYYYTPLGGATWTLNPSVSPTWDASVTFQIGDLPFITTPMPNATSAESYNIPLPAGEVMLQRGPWTDQAGDTLYKILAPHNTARDCVTGDVITHSGSAKDSIAPCYIDETVNGPVVQLANDWLTTPLGPVTNVGRHDYIRSLQHGDLTDIDNAPGNNGPVAGFYSYDDLFAISPADTDMLGHWSWSWVEAMYEMGLTNGLTATTYGPDLPVTRAEMATFLARVLDLYGLPTGTAAAFSDVPTAYWAHDAIATLRAYGISNGCGSNKFCPEAFVTRREMAKFIESTFRSITLFGGMYNGNPVYWDTSFHVLVPGLTFIDVPATDWANTWIEEMFWDNLTSGCMRDGLTLYYCPDANVTRGEMAKFIVTAIQPSFVTQGFWPILSPSK